MCSGAGGDPVPVEGAAAGAVMSLCYTAMKELDLACETMWDAIEAVPASQRSGAAAAIMDGAESALTQLMMPLAVYEWPPSGIYASGDRVTLALPHRTQRMGDDGQVEDVVADAGYDIPISALGATYGDILRAVMQLMRDGCPDDPLTRLVWDLADAGVPICDAVCAVT